MIQAIAATDAKFDKNVKRTEYNNVRDIHEAVIGGGISLVMDEGNARFLILKAIDLIMFHVKSK